MTIEINNVQEIISKIANPEKFLVVKDDHQNEKELKIDFPLIQVNPNGDVNICAGFDNTFSVNPLYLSEDGEVHLSTWSCGGVVDYRPGETKEEAVARYNASRDENPLWSQDRLSILTLKVPK